MVTIGSSEGGHAWLRHFLQAERSRIQVPMGLLIFFSLPNPFSRTMALGLTQPLAEMSTRNLPMRLSATSRKADNFTAVDCVENVAVCTPQNPSSLHGLLQG
jgi:hypothetical protein